MKSRVNVEHFKCISVAKMAASVKKHNVVLLDFQMQVAIYLVKL